MKNELGLSRTEILIIEEYRNSLTGTDSGKLTCARRMLSLMNPDAILLVKPDEMIRMLMGAKLYGGSQMRPSRQVCVLRYQIGLFQNFLQKKFDAGEHMDDWFEPEYMEQTADDIPRDTCMVTVSA